ncbi:MAG: thiol-disulfide isomerase [Acidobacteriota bacterium]
MIHRTGRVSAAITVGLSGLLMLTVNQAAAQSAQPTFSKDVAPVLYKHCTTCHRPGEAAPMSLLTYQEARPWARAIRDNVVNGTMPPWHADPAHGKFVNDRRLSAQEKEIISRWVAAGAPEGNPIDLPAKPTYSQGWAIGQPDVVLAMETPITVPAEGEIPYQYAEVATNFTEDKWIQALEIRPGDRSVVHHVLVYARHPGMTRQTPPFRQRNPPGPLSPTMEKELAEAKARGAAPSQSQSMRRGPLMAQTAPGTPPTVFAPGTALRVKAGSVLTFQIHYTTNGKVTQDRSSIGFKFAEQPPASEVYASAMMNPRFMIPAGADNHPVEAGMEFTEDVTLYSIVPHTHLRGRSWEHRLLYPDGREEILLAVPNYDFDWQTEYIFEDPLRIPKGAILKSVAHYNNSKSNAANPDPTQAVYWGDQTWEEMQYTALRFSIDKDRATTTQQKQ